MWKFSFVAIALIFGVSVNCTDFDTKSWFGKRPDGPDVVNEKVQVVFT
jgi:hypothetical protein